jgi:DNA-binding LytR/AlgR family response regulator
MQAISTLVEKKYARTKEAKLPVQYISLPGTNQERIRIALKDIVYMEGIRNYTMFVLRDGKQYLSTRTLKKYEEELPLPSFFRLHKSHVVNLNYLTQYDKEDYTYVILKNYYKIGVARRKRKDFENRLSQILFG